MNCRICCCHLGVDKVLEIVEVLFELLVELLDGESTLLGLLEFAVQANGHLLGDEELLLELEYARRLLAYLVVLVLIERMFALQVLVALLDLAQLEVQYAAVLGRHLELGLQLAELVRVVHPELVLQLLHLVADVEQLLVQHVVLQLQLLVQVLRLGQLTPASIQVYTHTHTQKKKTCQQNSILIFLYQAIIE